MSIRASGPGVRPTGPGIRASVVVLVALGLLGGAAWWTGWWGGRTATPPPGTGSTAARAVGPRAATASGPPTGAGSSTAAPAAGAAVPPASPSAPAPPADDRVPTVPPAGVTWQVWRTIALPTSPSAGPAAVHGDVASGFAHTPTGALLAAVQAASRRLAAGDGSWADVVRSMLAPGAGRDAWAAARARVRHPDDPVPGTFAQVAGFQFVSYTGGDAVLQLVSRADGGYGVVALHVTWLDGDWRLVLAPDGGDATSVQRATSLAGFVAWGGV